MKRVFVGLLFALALTTLTISPRAQSIAPYPTAPLCPTHDPLKYHGLWDAERGCHYDHHHGGNPHDLDDIFGTDVYDVLGSEGPGHPWQTFSAAGMENDVKHGGYVWHVFRDIVSNVTDFRMLVHQHVMKDAPVEFHSFVLEARLKNPDNSFGTIRAMGWMDCGQLTYAGTPMLVPNPRVLGTERQHSADSPNQIWYCADRGTNRLEVHGSYPRGLSVSSSVGNAWGGTESTAPYLADLFFCYGIIDPTRCRLNATSYRPHLIEVFPIQPEFLSYLDPDGNGWIDGTFYHDRYGVPAPSCTGEGLDCAPWSYNHVRTDYLYSCNDHDQCGSLNKNYDIMFGNRTSGWNTVVN